MMPPAMAGPITREILNAEELRAIAFIRSCFPTRSITNACRAGTSKALRKPKKTARTMTQGTLMRPNCVSTPSASASTSIPHCRRRMKRRLSTRSATTPP